MARRATPVQTPADPDETPLVHLPSVFTAGGGDAGGPTPFHDHPVDELILIDRGSCRISAAGDELEIAAPALVLMPHGVLHDQRSRPGTRSWYCTFRCPGRSFPDRPTTVGLDPGDPVRQWFPALCRHHLAADATPAAVAALLLAVLERLAASDHRAQLDRSLPPPVRAALRHIDRNPAGGLSAGDIARAAGIGAGHLRTLFRRHLGRSPQACHRDRRLDLAAKLLRGGQLRIQEVAAACGWADAEYFARLFHRRFGASPRAWRRAR